MRGITFLKFIAGIIVVAVLIKLSSKIFIEPRVKKQIEAAWNEKVKNTRVEIGRVLISMITSGIKLEMIRISVNRDQRESRELNGEIAFIKFKGIHLWKAVFKKDIEINMVIISSSSLKAKIPFPKEPMRAILSPLNISIHKVLFDQTDLTIENTLNAQAFSVKKGVLNLFDLLVEKKDTLSPRLIKQCNFEAEELLSVTPDSMYTFKTSNIIYSGTLNTLEIGGLSIKPGYTDYDFTARYKFAKDRIEAVFSNIFVNNFSAADYFNSGSILSSYIEIGNFDINVFRDSRKEFRHVTRSEFQDLIYSYENPVGIDSISIMNGNIVYTEHDAEANEPGRITFNEISAKIYNITNDTIYKTQDASLEFKCKALLMKKGKLTIGLKAKLFDSQNTFSVNGALSNLEVSELNPMLEKNAYVYVTSGKIDKMNFSFTANKSKATGRMTIHYHELDLTVKNKRTDDTTALKERISSLMANRKVIDSNPLKGEELREGIINYERDPEKFLFNYCLKSILSGVKSSILKTPKKKQIQA